MAFYVVPSDGGWTFGRGRMGGWVKCGALGPGLCTRSNGLAWEQDHVQTGQLVHGLKAALSAEAREGVRAVEGHSGTDGESRRDRESERR